MCDREGLAKIGEVGATSESSAGGPHALFVARQGERWQLGVSTPGLGWYGPFLHFVFPPGGRTRREWRTSSDLPGGEKYKNKIMGWAAFQGLTPLATIVRPNGRTAARARFPSRTHDRGNPFPRLIDCERSTARRNGFLRRWVREGIHAPAAGRRIGLGLSGQLRRPKLDEQSLCIELQSLHIGLRSLCKALRSLIEGHQRLIKGLQGLIKALRSLCKGLRL